MFAKKSIVLTVVVFLLPFVIYNPANLSAAKPQKKENSAKSEQSKLGNVRAAYDAINLSDMSDFDPATWTSPTGDTIKIAVVLPFSGPAGNNANFYWIGLAWAAHDINKRGGIFVDGKRKLIELIKADNMSKQDQTKKITERMVLQEKVNVLYGAGGGAVMKVVNEIGNKYKVITINATSLGDDLQDAAYFSRYAFQASASTEQIGRAAAYYYGQRRKEKKFYSLHPDYSLGHLSSDGFKKGLKEYYPEAQIVGEDFFKVYSTDYASYLEKIKASGAEVIYTSAFLPDAEILLKQARQMGVNLPFASFYMDGPSTHESVGVEGSKGLVLVSAYNAANPQFKTPGYIKFINTWHKQWKTKWHAPYNQSNFEYPGFFIGAWTNSFYWLLSVIERAKTLNPEKVIAIWEDDTYEAVNGKILKMRACDHKMIQDLTISELVPPDKQKVSFNIPPYYWTLKSSSHGPQFVVPAEKALPWMDQKLDRCKGKNDWGK